jgi:glycosyltransferase involved in cell wall biosynthesis
LCNKYDSVIAISRFDPALTDALRTIKNYKIPLIIKGDTDGTIGYPLTPNYLRTKPIFKHPLNILRHIKWRSKFSKAVKQKIEQIKLADLVVCESPGALHNINKVFDYWSLDKNKATFIPNPVSDVSTQRNICESKQKTIVSIGRWDDVACKGTDLLAKVIGLTSKVEINYEFIIIGNCTDKIKRLIPKDSQNKVTFKGHLSFEETQEIIAKAQILLVPSRLESFSLVTAEALCLGTTVVVTPIESLQYLAGDGKFGTVAKDFNPVSIKNALLHEIGLWEQGLRKPRYISTHWKKLLSTKSVGKLWMKNFIPTNIYAEFDERK